MKIKFSIPATFLFGLLVILAGAVLTGCESSSSGSGSGLQISMTVTPSSITVGETAIAEVTVTDGTNPMPNRAISFTVSPADAGYFTPAVDTTDANGEVSSVFTALTDGTVTLNAASGGSSQNFSLSIDEQTTVGSGNVDLVILPTMILADGASTAQLTVTVRDSQGDPAPDSTMIKLAAGEKFVDLDGNGYWTAGVDSLVFDGNDNGTWDAIGYIPATAYLTGGAGQATVDYTAGTEATTVYIAIRVDNSGGISGYAETSLRLTPDASISSIYMSADDIHLAVKRTGGMETSTLRAVGYDAFGNTVPEGLQISFIITDGPDDTDDGEHLANLTGAERRGPYVATTNSMGQASCPISSGTVSGTIRVRAYVDTVLSNSTQIMVHAGPPARIVIGAEECNVRYWGWVNETNDIVALVSDIYNNPCPDSTVVYFTCDEGVIIAHKDRVDEEDGIATTTWMSYGGDQSAGDDGIIWIKAETNGGTLVDSGAFINSWYPDTIWHVTWPQNLYAHNKSKGYIYVEVRDLNMNYCTDLDEIKFQSEYVDYIDRENGDGCFSSGISNYAVGVTLDADYSTNGTADDGIGAVDYLICRFGFMASSAEPCTLRTGMTYAKQCQIDLTSTVATSASVPFSVTVKDRWGNPLGDHELFATTSGGGSITNATQYTDSYGEANGFVFNAPALDATVTVSVEDRDARGGGVVLTLEVTVSSE